MSPAPHPKFPNVQTYTRAEAEDEFQRARERLRACGVADPEGVLAETCRCCVLGPEDWGTELQYAWDEYQTWRFMTGRDGA